MRPIRSNQKHHKTGYWGIMENRRAFLLDFAKKMSFDPMIKSNWEGRTTKLKEHGVSFLRSVSFEFEHFFALLIGRISVEAKRRCDGESACRDLSRNVEGFAIWSSSCSSVMGVMLELGEVQYKIVSLPLLRKAPRENEEGWYVEGLPKVQLFAQILARQSFKCILGNHLSKPTYPAVIQGLD